MQDQYLFKKLNIIYAHKLSFFQDPHTFFTPWKDMIYHLSSFKTKETLSEARQLFVRLKISYYGLLANCNTFTIKDPNTNFT